MLKSRHLSDFGPAGRLRAGSDAGVTDVSAVTDVTAETAVSTVTAMTAVTLRVRHELQHVTLDSFYRSP